MIPLHKRKQIRRPLSRVFPKTHPRAGEETNFVESINDGIKLHTLRHSYKKWKAISDKVNAGTHVLVFFEWDGLPYRSTQQDVLRYYELYVEQISLLSIIITHSDELLTTIANNDGLDRADFNAWFNKLEIDKLDDMAIVHLNDFRYKKDHNGGIII